MADDSEKDIDAFICHNLRDKPVIERLERWLKRQQYETWLDDAFLEAGTSLDEQIAAAARRARVAVVCIGPNLIGGYTEGKELPTLKAHVDKLIGVLLPHANDAARRLLERFVGEDLYVDLSKRSEADFDPIELDKLKRGLGAPLPRASGGREDAGPATDATQTLADAISTQGLTMFLGGTWAYRFESPTPDDAELAQYLAREALSLPVADLTLEEASHLFSLRHQTDERFLEAALLGFIEPRSTYRTGLYGQIASCIRTTVEKLEGGGRIGALVVFTTNIDVRLERALLELNHPFLRVVLGDGGRSLSAQAYCEIGGSASSGFTVKGRDGGSGQVRAETDTGGTTDEVMSWFTFARDCLYKQGIEVDEHPFALERFRQQCEIAELLGSDAFGLGVDIETVGNLDLDRLPTTILVKLRGSRGVSRSVSLRCAQVFNFAEFARTMPDPLREAVKNYPNLFLGFSPTEPMFTLVDHAFRSRNTVSKPNDCLVMNTGNGGQDRRKQLDDHFQPYLGENLMVRHKLRLIWDDPADFVERLSQSIGKLEPDRLLWRPNLG